MMQLWFDVCVQCWLVFLSAQHPRTCFKLSLVEVPVSCVKWLCLIMEGTKGLNWFCSSGWEGKMLTDKLQHRGEASTDTFSACLCFTDIFVNDLRNQGQGLVRQWMVCLPKPCVFENTFKAQFPPVMPWVNPLNLLRLNPSVPIKKKTLLLLCKHSPQVSRMSPLPLSLCTYLHATAHPYRWPTKQ